MTRNGSIISPFYCGCLGVIILLLSVVIGTNTVSADFNPSSFKSVEDCIKGTGSYIILSSDPGYQDARSGERIRVPTFPKAISYPSNSSQVSWLVKCSTHFSFRPVPRNGGHSSEGYSSVNNSVVIDISYIDFVSVDNSTKTAWVGGGIRLGPLYLKLDQAGFTIVSGLHPTIGLSGIIASGGWGLQSRKYGVTGDFAYEAEVVTADGNILTVNNNSYSDLFWALRGGGGGTYGIVTGWRLNLIDAWNNVTVWHIGYPTSYVKQAITAWTKWAWKERNDMTSILTITHDGSGTSEHDFGVKIRGHFLGTIDELLAIIANSGVDNITQLACVEYMSCNNMGSRAYFLGDDYNCSRIDLFNIGDQPYASYNYSLSMASSIVTNNSMTTTYSVTYNGGAGTVTNDTISGIPAGPKQIRELEKSKSMYFNVEFTDDQLNVIVALINDLPFGAFAQFDSYGGILATQDTNFTAFRHRKNTAFHLQIGVALTGNSANDSVFYEWIKKWDTQVRIFSNGFSYVVSYIFEYPSLYEHSSSGSSSSSGGTGSGTSSSGSGGGNGGTSGSGTSSNGSGGGNGGTSGSGTSSNGSGGSNGGSASSGNGGTSGGGTSSNGSGGGNGGGASGGNGGTSGSGSSSGGSTSTSQSASYIYFGENAPRLNIIKAKYDSQGVFTNTLVQALTGKGDCNCSDKSGPGIRSDAITTVKPPSYYLITFAWAISLTFCVFKMNQYTMPFNE
ncbi:5528_t:CDS:2 [Ambispora leptoticha]|uniref:5528_t:CDS:1 n=1 Tax=Ambispora leptoticha TaxID=144679 RepID=A0A9N9GZF3_9GLOM|nr:5528_t:CDS:2 [Ambispora leptoticha]